MQLGAKTQRDDYPGLSSFHERRKSWVTHIIMVANDIVDLYMYMSKLI